MSLREWLWSWRERSFLKRSSVALSTCYPNPERVDCPETSVLRRMAMRSMPLEEAAPYLEHLGSCSACFKDFTEFKKQEARQVGLDYRAAANALRNAPGLSGLNANDGQNSPLKAILDLRTQWLNRDTNSVQETTGKLPEFSRLARKITVLLPPGAEGQYAIEFRTESGTVVATSQAAGRAQDGYVVLIFRTRLIRLQPGVFELRLLPSMGQILSCQVRLK